MYVNNDIPYDAGLPHLPSALNTFVMQETFQKALSALPDTGHTYRIRSCDIVHIRYKRGRYGLILYRLTFEDESHRCLGEQMVCSRLFPIGESTHQYRKAKLKPLVKPAFGKPLYHFPAYDMVVWAFPNDRKLFALAALTNHQQLQDSILPPVLAGEGDSEWNIHSLTTDIAHYVPEHACMFRFSLLVSQNGQENQEHLTLYGKTYDHEHGTDIFQVMRQLWKSEARREQRILLPKPVAYDHSLNMLWQSCLPGSPLTHYALHHPSMTFWMKQAGQAIATFHQIPVEGLRHVRTHHLLTRLEENAQQVVGIRPAIGPTLEGVVHQCRLQAATLLAAPQVTLHGDLHRKNIFVHEDTIGFIDLDGLCVGSPLMDIGSFLASLYFRIVLSEVSRSHGQTLMDSFIQGYQSRIPWTFPSSDIAWHIAVSLITEQAYRCGTTFKAKRLGAIDALVNEAHILLTHGMNHSLRPQIAPSMTIQIGKT